MSARDTLRQPPRPTPGATIAAAYLVCAVQRSGSSLLCEALKSTGVAGVPEEYFLDAQFENGAWARSHAVTTRDAYLDLVKRTGTTPNGVFGGKMMWNYFAPVVAALNALPAYTDLPAGPLFDRLLPNLKYVWIVRADKVRQAVSWAIAAQTGIYHAAQPGADAAPEPTFDFTLIDNLHRLIHEGEAGWRAYFEANGITPLEIVYESFVADYAGTVRRILNFLAIDNPADRPIAPPPIRRQATSRNAEWAARYRALKGLDTP